MLSRPFQGSGVDAGWASFRTCRNGPGTSDGGSSRASIDAMQHFICTAQPRTSRRQVIAEGRRAPHVVQTGRNLLCRGLTFAKRQGSDLADRATLAYNKSYEWILRPTYFLRAPPMRARPPGACPCGGVGQGLSRPPSAAAPSTPMWTTRRPSSMSCASSRDFGAASRGGAPRPRSPHRNGRGIELGLDENNCVTASILLPPRGPMEA